MKIKIINMLVKMANDENYKPTFKYKDNIYQYDFKAKHYMPLFMGLYKIYMILNDEVEILEEPKKIEKITVREKTLGFPNGEWTARNMDKAFAIKINELIDEINNLKEK